MKILNIDSLIDLKANESIRKMVEDLKEYIELKFVSLALVNDKYSFFCSSTKVLFWSTIIDIDKNSNKICFYDSLDIYRSRFL